MYGVVIGVRRADGRWLLVRRSTHVALPHKVCFPGGAMESGETQEQACVREAREELGITVRPLQLVWKHEFADRPITLFGWLVDVEQSAMRPDPMEIEEVLWLTPAEGASHPDGLPTNREFIEALEGAIGARR
jgi:8-oxo-dGTP diphosphatase